MIGPGEFRRSPSATAYLHSHAYPDERLPAILHHLMDLKLKLYWLAEPSVVDGRALVRAGWTLAAPADHPDLYLRRLSLDVSQILISRSAFDSLMGAICFLEIGRKIEALGRRGKISRFFDLLNDSPAWSGFVRYRAVVEAFDERVRVAEAHKYSRLRAAFVDPTRNRPNVFAVSNAILVNFWENLVLVTAGMAPLVEHKGFDVDEVVRELREDERLDHEVAADE